MPLLLGDILKTVRKAVGWTQEELADKLGIVRGTYSSDERAARPERIHGSLEFYEKYKAVLGIDLYQSVNQQKIVIVDPTKLFWNWIIKLKELGAVINMTPVFDSGVMHFYANEKNIKPAFFLPSQICPNGEFGIFMRGNSMEPAIYDGDHVICGPRLSVENVISGHIYLVCTGEENTIKMVHVDLQQQLLLTTINSNWPSKLITRDKVRYIHKVIALLRKEAGINRINQTG